MASNNSPMTDHTQIGRYGTISLLKQNEPNVAVTSFGIDSETLTFGRDKDCSIRLFYQDVDPVHCKINFRDRKAFLVVLGSSGLVIDGCKAYPGSATGSPITIPLLNDSVIEIHGKRFRFTYPPKEMRAQLYDTPPQPNRRALRLSMIHSAEVFTPRPSSNPMENLRVLQSPLRPSFRSRSVTPSPSPLQTRSLFGNTAQSGPHNLDDEDEPIVLVNGDNPRVVEEDKDLVILEDVEVSPSPSTKRPVSPTKNAYVPAPPPTLSLHVPPAPPVTPRRSRPSLHRAVLIRSAQRAVLKAREEEEEEEEEMEVFGTIFAEEDEEEEDEDDQRVPTAANEDEDMFNDDDDEETNDEQADSGSLWRKSLGRMWPFTSRSPSPTKESTSPPKSPETPVHDVDAEDGAEEPPTSDPVMDIDADEDKEEDEEEAQENIGPLRVIAGTPIRKSTSASSQPPLRGLFMTPQPQPSSSSSNPAARRERMSLGGQAMRIKVEEKPWKVEDIVLPGPPAASSSSSTTSTTSTTKSTTRAPAPAPVPATPNRLSEAERAAIRERRRSALKMPFGGIPGLGNGPSSSPMKRDVSEQPLSSPFKARRTGNGTGTEESIPESKEKEDDGADARTLLERMKGAVEEMKSRRASMGVGMSPVKPSDDGKDIEERTTATTTPTTEQEQFSLLRTPDARRLPVPRRSIYVLDPPRGGAMEVDSSSPTKTVPEKEATAQDEDVKMLPPPPPALKSPIKTRTRTTTVDTPSLADDEASPAGAVAGKDQHGGESSEENGEKEKPKAKVMKGRGKKVEESTKPPSKTQTKRPKTPVAADEEEAPAPAPAKPTKPASTTRTRSKTPVSAATEPPRTTRRARTVEPESTVPKKPMTTTRRAGSAIPTPTPAPATRATRRGATTATSESESEVPTTKTRARAGRKKAVEEKEKEKEKDDDDDPLEKEMEEPTPAPAPAPTKPAAKRGRPAKAAAVVPPAIKEEEPDVGGPAKAKTTRSKKTALGTEADNLPAAATTTTTTKSRGAKSSKVVEPEEVDDKENSDNEVVVTVAKTRSVAATRTTRKTTTKTKVKEEAVTEPELGAGTGARTRAMRTRSRT